MRAITSRADGSARGVEVDLVWEPAPAFSLLANYAYTDTRDDGVAPGDRIARVPETSGRVAARYRLLHGPAKGLSFGAGITAFTSRQLTLPNSIASPGYAGRWLCDHKGTAGSPSSSQATRNGLSDWNIERRYNVANHPPVHSRATRTV